MRFKQNSCRSTWIQWTRICLKIPILLTSLRPTTAAISAPTPVPGTCVLDIVFAVDMSGSIKHNQPPGVDNMALIRLILQYIVQPPINIGTDLDHVGMVEFGDTSNTLYTFHSPQNIDSFISKAVNGMTYIGYESNIPAGLDAAYNILVPRTREAQPVIILITDGVTSPQFTENFSSSVQRLKDAGITRIALGVTTQISYPELQYFASGTEYISTFQSYQQVLDVQNRVINNLLIQCRRPTINYNSASSARSIISSIRTSPATVSVSNTFSTTFPFTFNYTTKNSITEPPGNNTALAIGLAAGLGATGVNIIIIIIIIFCKKRRKSKNKENETVTVNLSINPTGDVSLNRYRALDETSLNSSGYGSVQHSEPNNVQTYIDLPMDSNFINSQQNQNSQPTETIRARGYLHVIPVFTSNISDKYDYIAPSEASSNSACLRRVTPSLEASILPHYESAEPLEGVSGNASHTPTIYRSNNLQGYERVGPSDGASLHSYLALDSTPAQQSKGNRQKAPCAVIVDQRRKTLQPL